MAAYRELKVKVFLRSIE